MISSSVQARATIATEEVIVLLSGSTSDVVVFRRALGNLEGLSGDDNVRGVCCTTPFLAIWMLLVRYSTTLMASNLPIHAMTERCHVRFACHPRLVSCRDGKLGRGLSTNPGTHSELRYTCRNL